MTGGQGPRRASARASSFSAAASPASARRGSSSEADVDVVVVDANDYHSFQPMLYQLATGLLDTTAVAHSLRDLFQHQQNAPVHQATRLGDRSRCARGAVRRHGAAALRLPRHRRSGRSSSSSAARARPSTRSRSTRSRTRCACARRSSGAGRLPIATPSLVGRRSAERRRRRRRPDRDRERRRTERALPQRLREGLPRGTRDARTRG